MKKIFPLLITSTFLLVACVNVNIGKDMVLITNKNAAAHKIDFGERSTFDQVKLPYNFIAQSGELPASFGKIAYSQIQTDRKKPLVVFCGGNAFRLNYRGYKYAQALAQYGDVFAFDYPGLGDSAGEATKAQFEETLKLVSQKTKEIAAQNNNGKIIYYGHSFGGGVCSSLAHDNPDAIALVLAGTFANYEDAAHGIKPILANFARFKVSNDTPEFKIPQLLANYENPVFVIASHKDDTVKFGVTQKLYEKLLKQGNKAMFIPLENAPHGLLPADAETLPKLTAALQNSGIE